MKICSGLLKDAKQEAQGIQIMAAISYGKMKVLASGTPGVSGDT